MREIEVDWYDIRNVTTHGVEVDLGYTCPFCYTEKSESIYLSQTKTLSSFGIDVKCENCDEELTVICTI